MAGVACFKIEGRLKGPEYVALTTQVGRGLGSGHSDSVPPKFPAAARLEGQQEAGQACFTMLPFVLLVIVFVAAAVGPRRRCTGG